MRQQLPTQSPSASSTGSPTASVSVEENLTEGKPPKKRFRLLSGLIEEQIKQKNCKHPGLLPEEEEINRYFSITTTLGEKVDPVFFVLDACLPWLCHVVDRISCCSASWFGAYVNKS